MIRLVRNSMRGMFKVLLLICSKKKKQKRKKENKERKDEIIIYSHTKPRNRKKKINAKIN